MQKKKLQVFVSSTYTDMMDERQAAVEAILTAGHIPAGMELFAAGDQSQLDVIRRWIDESDVFMLLMGGRYGSLEPKTSLSYIQLEYEHALASAKPLFAVIIDTTALEEKVKRMGSAALETDSSQKLRDFRAQVLTRVVRFWRDPRDIKLAILETLAEYGRVDSLTGWVKADQYVNVAALAEEIARLAKENATLRAEVASKAPPDTGYIYQGLTFDEFYHLLATTATRVSDATLMTSLEGVSSAFGDSCVGLLHLLCVFEDSFRRGLAVGNNDALFEDATRLTEYGILELGVSTLGNRGNKYFQTFELSKLGNQFLMRLRVKRDAQAADQYKAVLKPRE